MLDAKDRDENAKDSDDSNQQTIVSHSKQVKGSKNGASKGLLPELNQSKSLIVGGEAVKTGS